MKRALKFGLSLTAAVVGAVGLTIYALRDAAAAALTYPVLDRYPPGSPEQIALFEAAARAAGLPVEWARSSALANIIRRESDGRVGVKNPSSSASGIGQLIDENVLRFYPSGRAGVGDPLEEAIGMLRYIASRYGTPERAWELYGKKFAGY
jgi:hypothetical protein